MIETQLRPQRRIRRIPEVDRQYVFGSILIAATIILVELAVDPTRNKVTIVNTTENNFRVSVSEFPYESKLLNEEVLAPRETRELFVRGGRDIAVKYYSRSVDGRAKFVWLRTWGNRIRVTIKPNAENELSISSSPLREWFDANRHLPFPESWL